MKQIENFMETEILNYDIPTIYLNSKFYYSKDVKTSLINL